MYIVGQEEIDALARVVGANALFRYGVGTECTRFEERYAGYLGAKYVALAASGTNALTAAVVAAGLGPGDEVLIPAHTYMATATSVLAAGAIPVIVDIDESLTINPLAAEDAVGPSTRAIIPVHMWGTACDLDAIMKIAQQNKLIVIEDACQGVGGAYHGRKMGTIGDIGAYSFNFYKNMTAGEGGAVTTSRDDLAERARCAIDPCNFYWQGRSDGVRPFAGNGARASELMGAMLNVQLDRLPGMIEAMRKERDAILSGVSAVGNLGVRPAKLHSPEDDCGTHALLRFPSAAAASQFAVAFPSVVAGKTGRHNYTEWDQVLQGRGAAHPAMNPYNMEANRKCRRQYSKDMCAGSIEILNRTVLVPTHPLHTDKIIADIVHNVAVASRVALEGLDAGTADLRNVQPIEARRFDLQTGAGH